MLVLPEKDKLQQKNRLAEQVRAGAIGLKVHEDWGATASAIDHSLQSG